MLSFDLSKLNCKTLKSMLKNPDSFTLFDDILILEQDADDPYGTSVFIPYGGTNSYGGMVQSVAIFANEEYLGDYGEDTEDDFPSEHDYNKFLIVGADYKIALINDNFEKFIHIDSEKILDKLN